MTSTDPTCVPHWPKITVVTPSYNQGRFLEATLRSVLEQDYPNLEYIVVDGGSTDESVDIIRRYEDRLNYWHSRKDNGQADAIASGFEMATGEILCWLNSDDVFLPGTLRHVAGLFLRHPDSRFVYGNRRVIDESGVVTDSHHWPYFIHRYHWALGQYLAQECTFWKADLYRQVGGIDRSRFFIMDYDLFFRMWRVTRFRKTSRFLGSIRVHGETKNSLHQPVRERELEEALARYGIRKPGPLLLRAINRFDHWQTKFERWLIRTGHV
ncbi:MAG: glycosyltransferase family 2 protein [Pseudomonadota bacterium]